MWLWSAGNGRVVSSMGNDVALKKKPLMHKVAVRDNQAPLPTSEQHGGTKYSNDWKESISIGFSIYYFFYRHCRRV